MSTGSDSSSSTIYDLIGVGFGPSNLALSGALIEKWTTPSNDSEKSFRTVLFLERQPSFQWHPGMLLPGAQMQISFLKDLATLRSPQSALTFVNYLHSHGRLTAFINRGSFTPSRREFADYLGWAARYVEEHGVNVNYGQEVVAIDESSDGLIIVTSRSITDGRLNIHITRNLVLSPGGSARIPNVVLPLMNESSIVDRSTLLHSSEYKNRVAKLLKSITSSTAPRPLRVAVIGGGQSAAEVTMNLRNLLSNIPSGNAGHQVDMLIRKGSLKPSDDSHFSNEIFAPEGTGNWFSTSEQGREYLMAEYKDTNYSVVNPCTLAALHEIIYDQKVEETITARNSGVQKTPGPKINIRSHIHIASLKYDVGSQTFTFTLRNALTREIFEHETYDAIVCATGYQRHSWIEMLSDRLKKRFGIGSCGSDVPIRLVPFAQRATYMVETRDDSSNVCNTPDSIATTPSISSSTENVSQQEVEPVNLYITRRYRLLPIASSKIESEETLKARIYIQGLEEATHGLSDTLLSVVSCRAGEVVDDLLSED
ncbi:putative L-ornithine-N5-monooxygenase [Lentinula guzmanii]|uniref:L-ornithine N(5)-monooxygenase [NAD(P)H] n=1 Tax=Lentinula guzmanii TaxID=2804957 RepID=A0AA38J803_9AGAR|nr:putative L-ornithine-N5-monooxygenase [Lentinula guzmanii]